MKRRGIRVSLYVAIGLVVLAAVVPASATAYLTTTVTQTGIKHTTINGISGVLVNYTDSSTLSFTGYLYFDLSNPKSQSVAVSVATCNLIAGQTVSCFVVIPSVASGNYTARVFATTNETVAVSSLSSIQVTV